MIKSTFCVRLEPSSATLPDNRVPSSQHQEVAAIQHASRATRSGGKTLLAQLFPRLSVAPLGGRARSRPRAALRDQAPRLHRQLLPSGAASGKVAPRKRRPSRNVASGSRANDSADNDDRDGPSRCRSRDWVDDLANRRRFAMHQAAWFVDAPSGGKGLRSEKRLGGLHRHASARHAIPRHSPKQRYSEIRRLARRGITIRHLRNATLCSNSAAISRRRHKRVDQRLEQWPNRRAHQSIEDHQARDVWSRWRRTPTRPDVASPLADSARKVRQTRFECKSILAAKFNILK